MGYRVGNGEASKALSAALSKLSKLGGKDLKDILDDQQIKDAAEVDRLYGVLDSLGVKDGETNEADRIAINKQLTEKISRDDWILILSGLQREVAAAGPAGGGQFKQSTTGGLQLGNKVTTTIVSDPRDAEESEIVAAAYRVATGDTSQLGAGQFKQGVGPLKPTMIIRDELGQKHVRMEQRYEGKRIYRDGQTPGFAQLTSHLRGEGQNGVSGELLKITDLSNTLGIMAEQAAKDIALPVALEKYGSPTKPGGEKRLPVVPDEIRVERIVYEKDGDSQETFLVSIPTQIKRQDPRTQAEFSQPVDLNYIIDADGNVLKHFQSRPQSLVFLLLLLGGALLLSACRPDKKDPAPEPEPTPTPTPKPPAVGGVTVQGSKVAGENLTLIASVTKGDKEIQSIDWILTTPDNKTVAFQTKGTTTRLSVSGTKLTPHGDWRIKLVATDTAGKTADWSGSFTLTASVPLPDPGVADDESRYEGTVAVGHTSLANGTTQLGTAQNQTFDAKDTDYKRLTDNPIVSPDSKFGTEDGKPVRRQQVDVNAQFAAEATRAMYREMLGKNSFDGKGAKIISYTHVTDGGESMMNAFFTQRRSDGYPAMFYGDGGEWNGQVLFTELVSVDVGSHEIGHGRTDATSQLEYEKQAGGMNEAMSDIYGVAAKLYVHAKKNPGMLDRILAGEDIELPKNFWLIGDQIFTPSIPDDGLRNMANQAEDGRSLTTWEEYKKREQAGDEDALDPHFTSGLPNKVFYTLVTGDGMLSHLPFIEALKIFDRANEIYLQPNSGYHDFLKATKQAAKDLFGEAGEAKAQIVAEAWAYVGIKQS